MDRDEGASVMPRLLLMLLLKEEMPGMYDLRRRTMETFIFIF